MNAIQLGAISQAQTLNGSPLSENFALPVNSNGKVPTWTYIAADGDIQFLLATNESGSVRTVAADLTVTATTGVLLNSANPLVVNTRGYTHIMTIGTASELLVLTPLEN